MSIRDELKNMKKNANCRVSKVLLAMIVNVAVYFPVIFTLFGTHSEAFQLLQPEPTKIRNSQQKYSFFNTQEVNDSYCFYLTSLIDLSHYCSYY